MIEQLPVLMQSEARRARTLARCHARLAVRRRRIEARRQPLFTVEHLLLAGVCVVCLVSMAGNVLAIVRAL